MSSVPSGYSGGSTSLKPAGSLHETPQVTAIDPQHQLFYNQQQQESLAHQQQNLAQQQYLLQQQRLL